MAPPRPRFRLVVLKAIWRTLFFLAVVPGPGAWGEERGTVKVDFSRAEKPVSMGGILEGLNPTEPADDSIRPIVAGGEYARHFSYGPYRDAAARSRALGYRLIIRLDRYELFGQKMWPYQDWKSWEDYVEAQAGYWGADVIYDVWNEPALPEYWNGTEEQYFETYTRAYQVLERVLGSDVQVTGPSSQQYDRATVARFLDYCQAAKVRVPVLNWHELVDPSSARILKDLVNARRNFQENPRYASLGIKRLMINEAFPTEDAAAALGEFWALETGGAAGAVNSCFEGDCEKGSLSGLLTSENRKRRSSWFVYQGYAAGVKGRVHTATNNSKTIGLGSLGGRAQVGTVLIGYDQALGRAEVTLELRGFKERDLNRKMEISWFKLENSRERESPGFVPAGRESLAPVDGVITLKKEIAAQEVYQVEIR